MRILCFVLFGTAASAGLVAAEPLTDPASPLETLRTEFGMADGPAWDGAAVLYVPDVKGQKLFAYRPLENTWSVVLEDSGRISATYYDHGRLYLSDNGNAAIAWVDGQAQNVLWRWEGDKPPRPNDLVVDRSGGVYVTLTSSGQVAYVTAEGHCSTAVASMETPNGIALSSDEQLLYVAAYKPKQIWTYEVSQPGVMSGGRLFAQMDDGDAPGADGMTIDRNGNVYCAGAADVWIWNPQGELMQRLPCPSRPINCAFGDSDLKSLYITGLGGVYRQRMLVAGQMPRGAASAPGRTGNE
jgi:gluconolactonase